MSVPIPATFRRPRLEFLDGVRGMAALFVIFEHAGYRFIPHFRYFSHAVISFGKFGVAAFFLVSGFVIPMSLDRTASLHAFWGHRFFRLYPLYWFSLIAVTCLYSFGLEAETTPLYVRHFFAYTVVNASMLQGLVGVPHAIGVYYTLTIELVFYIACSFLIMIGQFRRSLHIAYSLLALSSAIWIVVPLVLHRRVEMAGLFYGVTLSIGTVVYRRYQGQISRPATALILWGLGLLTATGVWLNYSVFKKTDPLEHYTFWSVMLSWLGAYILFLAAYKSRSKRCPLPLPWLGKISYSLYLLHPLVLSLVARSDISDTSQANVRGFALFILLILGLSYVTYSTIERPMIILGSRLISRKQLPERS